MSDANRSVNLSGSTVGVISTGDNAHISIGTQQIASLQNASADAKEKLTQLIEQLNAELQKVPADKKKEAAEITELTDSLLQEASQQKPKQSLIKVTAKGLIDATKALAGVIPLALPIAESIASTISVLNP
ncbi:hypothetical protein [Beggiatoa leptomitoformis]|uniref:Uncharacterized protein n=1 Tax=Beggiatoa leptomitoformis TaxID=288004 RepID=A0A2N9YDI0_9GAMM|nr:hypothetical protein [Beggiatoa leptomitoformis]ALG69154.1 hypothetical protein AL038_17505 [Beggiatoa leptomitoformis]AUI68425.1 hypothetical protein BLE401_06715 [Beggiatoa leptomitoformis]